MSDRLAASKYVRLVTFRKTGAPVATPMWFGLDASGRLYMQTNAASAKIKRLRNRSDVELAPSDWRGQPQGPSFGGHATIHPAASPVAQRSIELLTRHYGWVFRIFNFFLWLFRRDLVYLEIELAANGGSSLSSLT